MSRNCTSVIDNGEDSVSVNGEGCVPILCITSGCTIAGSFDNNTGVQVRSPLILGISPVSPSYSKHMFVNILNKKKTKTV